MAKKRSTLFWIVFWVISAVLLAAWFVFLQVKNRNVQSLEQVTSVLPVSSEMKDDMKTLVSIADYVLRTDGKNRVFLILFQNNMEIRPGGGFIGSFGILKINNGHVTEFTVHDTGNFDGRVPRNIPAPYPMKETLRIDSLQFRDSNYSPDFGENVKQAEYFYQAGDGQEKFDGVIGITANVLTSFLKVTGPVEIPGYPGVYDSENAILDLEQQVEKKYIEQGIEKGNRKSVMNLLGYQILDRVKYLSLSQKYTLFQTVLEDLKRKDIQLYFHDTAVQERVRSVRWDGRADTAWQDDYLMVSDANLGAFKSDYYVKRSVDYTVDFSKSAPHARVAITYRHTATEKSWLTKDYITYLRTYVPAGSWLTSVSGNAADPVFGEDLNKKYFGILVHVPLNSEKTVVIEYDLPQNISQEYYDLKIQKQPGINDVPATIHLIRKNGSREDRNVILNQDWEWFLRQQ